MLYVLDHYYAINHPEFCIIIESDKKVEEIIEICSSIAFLLEDIVDVSACLDMKCLLNILITYYGAKDKKLDVEDEMLNSLRMPTEGIYEKIFLAHDGIVVSNAYLIDLYEARESCCGERYKEIMNKWLPKGKKLDEIKEILIKTGVEK